MSAHVEPLRLVLLAEEPEWAALLRARLETLGGAFPLITAPNWEAASSLFDDGGHGLLLTTLACQPAPGRCSLPTILLLDEEPVVEPADVCDWLVRDNLGVDLLRRCLRYAGERGRLQATLQRLAEQDPLTGIANRQGFQTLLAGRLAEHQGRGLALGHLDLDNFKHVNDSLGYQAGDRLILQVVNRLKAQLEPGDALARLGSDEFALLIDNRRDPQRAERVAERITEVLSEPYWLDGESLLLGCSLGLAHARAGESADPLLWHAHIAMQQAKAAQGCTHHLYDERIHRGARSMADLEGELRRALRRDELELHYQPRLCLQSGRILGLEALVRWRHAERGLLGPDEFVPLAEESGLIFRLDEWVISEALQQVRRWQLEGIGLTSISVNINVRHLGQESLTRTVSQALEATRLDPSTLTLELTESEVMQDVERSLERLNELRAMGVRLALDDFGTGYSSLGYLTQLPVDCLKIDRSFIHDMQELPQQLMVVRGIVALSSALGLPTVAEGVESNEDLRALRRIGCHLVQGYLFTEPLTAGEFADWWREALAMSPQPYAGQFEHLLL